MSSQINEAERDDTIAKASGTERDVIHDIAKRQQMGMSKYGTSVRENPLSLRAWLVHSYEEALDLAIYLRRCIEEIDNGGIQ